MSSCVNTGPVFVINSYKDGEEKYSQDICDHTNGPEKKNKQWTEYDTYMYLTPEKVNGEGRGEWINLHV